MSVCIVTGGAGFIGCAMSEGLVQRFDRVIAIDSLLPQVHAVQERPADLHPDVEFIHADVAEAATWDKVLADVTPDVIVHLAAETGTGQSLTESTRHATSNVLGTTAMLDGFVRHGKMPSKIILASSCAVYGEGAWADADGSLHYPGQRTHAMLEAGIWDFEGMAPVAQTADKVSPSPSSVYAATKLCQEHLVVNWCQSMGVTPVLYRLQNVYGVGQSLTNPYTGIVPLFARIARSGKAIPVYEDGDIIRDFVYITDVANALLAGVDRDESVIDPYDIGCGVKTSILDLARIVATKYNAPEPQITGQFRDGDVRARWADISRAQRGLDWSPAVPVEEGINRLCDWIDSQGATIES